ncbi:hypothetical protein BCR35DRAFT_45243 [Leucosporidium creatinivorum]|uniref:Uncharacterized protein n=1 Tax=Leucosporidium creatinivorum TaxID=106004 RepID=A0A1Y2FU45_9BASI|nr:hypothetical protein BCR35DRAFT_45243 [Leucosporidium creatinivorum]
MSGTGTGRRAARRVNELRREEAKGEGRRGRCVSSVLFPCCCSLKGEGEGRASPKRVGRTPPPPPRLLLLAHERQPLPLFGDRAARRQSLALDLSFRTPPHPLLRRPRPSPTDFSSPLPSPFPQVSTLSTPSPLLLLQNQAPSHRRLGAAQPKSSAPPERSEERNRCDRGGFG